MEARDLHSLTESDSSFLQQQYCSICKCLEESSMSLLLLRQSFPSCVCDYPMEVKDLMQKISSDLMQSILELNPTLSMFFYITIIVVFVYGVIWLDIFTALTMCI